MQTFINPYRTNNDHTHEQCMKYNFVAPLKVPCTFFERNYQTKQQLVSNNGNDGKTIFEKILIN